MSAALAGLGFVSTRLSDRLAHAHDASHFLLTPAAVATPRDAEEVGTLIAASRAAGLPVTFRSGGTSLSGQAVTDGVLADVRRHFRGIEVLDDGARVRLGPGATIRQVNQRLHRHGRKLGPDPASEIACTVGGMVANNSSGMACGIEANTYRTLDSLVAVLPSGTVVDTAAPDADERLRALEPELHTGLVRLRDRVRGDAASMRVLAAQYAMKNTMGYGLNSLVDHDRAVDILAHLLVGSEGTLAFIASATLRTVPLLPAARTGLLVFEDLARATAALPDLVASGPAAVELMDPVSLRVAQRDPQADAALAAVEVAQHTALLVEYQAATEAEVEQRSAQADALLGELPLAAPYQLSSDAATRTRLWHVRKGLYATVAGARPAGTTALLEDMVVPVPRLQDTCAGLTELLARHRYREPVVFGHAKDGNLHFMLTESFDSPAGQQRFVDFSDGLADLVLGNGGSLKAEHGTGRQMAPFVRRQFGDELYDVMCEVKRLFDPDGLLAPGVLVGDDATIHLRDLKPAVTVDEEVDRCVECGYCEPVCPSRDLTTTPRQRIVLRREVAAARAAGEWERVAELEQAYAYDAVATCAVDGMCQTACPVQINTGDLMRRLRGEASGRLTHRTWDTAARHWAGATRVAGGALSLAAGLPAGAVERTSRAARKVGDPGTVPAWSRELPRGGSPRPEGGAGPGAAADVVLFSACVGSIFGPSDGGLGARTALERLCARAGLKVVYPAGLPGLCCGTPWKSKGFADGHETMRDRVLPALASATGGGALPVVCDASSCTEGLRHLLAGEGTPRLRVLDAVEYVDQHVLPRLEVRRRVGSLALHPTCSTARMDADGALARVAAAVADRVTVPDDWGCCAYAGDRGLLHPELTDSATRRQAAQVRAVEHDAYASCNRTCELGMTRATGRPYQHVLELLEVATRPADAR